MRCSAHAILRWNLIRRVNRAINLAKNKLEACAAEGFAGAQHRMRFGRDAGFRNPIEIHSSDVFQRAVIGVLLLDIANFLKTHEHDRSSTLMEIAAEQRRYIVDAKLDHRLGGWSYFSSLSELPPDLDTLGGAVELLASSPELQQHWRDAVDVALTGQHCDGAIGTWVISERDAPEEFDKMQKGVERYWGDCVDAPVCSRFLNALGKTRSSDYHIARRYGASYVAKSQWNSGVWSSTWYWGPYYPTYLCVSFLSGYPSYEPLLSRVEEYLYSRQHGDGGWGGKRSNPLDTAAGILTLFKLPALRQPGSIARALRFLVSSQLPDGSWRTTPWIRMPIGRAEPVVHRFLAYSCPPHDVAMALNALVAGRCLLEK